MHGTFQNNTEKSPNYSLPHWVFYTPQALATKGKRFQKIVQCDQQISSANNCLLLISLYCRIIKAYKTSEFLINLTDWSNSCNEPINYLEHVEVSVNLTYTLRGELLIKLISPQGTASNLTHYRKADASFGAKDLNWVLMTLHHWGENATGIWKLTLESSHPNHNNKGY